jgi:GT2 family glycosyltransferase
MKTDVAVIVLNWNGWKDTLECLASIKGSSSDSYTIIVVDNGSTDNSIERIKQWANGDASVEVCSKEQNLQSFPLAIKEIRRSDLLNGIYPDTSSSPRHECSIVIIRNDTNLGFAGGMNVGIKYALQHGFDKIFLLNNDTVVHPDCIGVLSAFLDIQGIYDIVTPKIYYYGSTDRIWNCGGKLTWTGSRRYYYYDRQDSSRTKGGIKKVTFITGCAFFIRADIFKKYGMFTEKFFFGEEDYEFCMRMKKNRIRIAANMSAIVFHKMEVSQRAAFQEDALAKFFIFYLNRFINMKSYYPKFYWRVWRFASFFYILPLLMVKYRVLPAQGIRFAHSLLKYSSSRVCVTRSDFFNAKTLIN